MKICVVLLSAFLLVNTLAQQTDSEAQFTNLLQTRAKAQDAVDSAFQVLRDLKQVNIDNQGRADAFNQTLEASCQKTITALSRIAENNKEIGTDATTRRKWLQQEIQDTEEYLAWITNRRDEILRKGEELEAQRCYSNNVFIRQLKQTDEAIKVVGMLRDELIPFSSQERSDASSQNLVQLKALTDAFDKVSVYSHLFSDSEVKEFSQLQEQATQSWVDNDRGALEVGDFEYSKEARNLKGGLGDKLIQMLNDLEKKLQDTISNLQASELAAAKQFVQWLIDTDNELRFLDAEEARKKTYHEKLQISLIVAQAHEDKSWEIYYESATVLNDAINSCDDKRKAYAADKSVRDEENAILDDIIKVFANQVATVDNKIRQYTF